MTTTPLEREILTHYYCSAPGVPFRSRLPLILEIEEKFIKLGLLQHGIGCVKGNEEALRVYHDALASVPLPVQQWNVPEWFDRYPRKPLVPYAVAPGPIVYKPPCPVSMPGGSGLDCTCYEPQPPPGDPIWRKL